MNAEEYIEKWAQENFVDRDNWFDDAVKELMESYAKERVRKAYTQGVIDAFRPNFDDWYDTFIKEGK